MYCKGCGSSIPDDSKVCPNCGIRLTEQKFCKHCGQSIDIDCIVCPKCGKQVENMDRNQPNIVINNSNTNTNVNQAGGYGRPKNKRAASFL